MRPLLEGLGLTPYEARSLEVLIKHGHRTGPEISREAGVPTGRVYDVVNGLVERGLVVIQPGRPKQYAAVASNAIPDRLHAAVRRRLDEDERIAQQQATRLQAELLRAAPAGSQATGSYGVRLGEDAARGYLVEATYAARNRVDAYLTFEHIDDDDLALFDAFQESVGRGLQTRILLREADVDYLMGTPYVGQVLDALLPHLGARLQVRITRSEAVPFSVLDNERVMLGVRDPLDPRRYFAVVHVEDRGYAGQLIARFDHLWKEAELDKGLVQRVLRKIEADPDSRTSKMLTSLVRRRTRGVA